MPVTPAKPRFRSQVLSGTVDGDPGLSRVTVVKGRSLAVLRCVDLNTVQAPLDVVVKRRTNRVYVPTGLAVGQSTNTV